MDAILQGVVMTCIQAQADLMGGGADSDSDWEGSW